MRFDLLKNLTAGRDDVFLSTSLVDGNDASRCLVLSAMVLVSEIAVIS